MADPAPTQSNGDPAAGGKPDVDGGAQPPANQQNSNSGDIDLSKLEGDQLAKVLENPNLWKQPRIQELVKSNQELKKLQDSQRKAEEKRLEENNEHKTLAEQRKAELEKANETIQNMKIDQALMGKLVPEGVVDVEAALKLVDRSKVKVDDDGNITGLDEVVQTLKTDKAYLFGKPGTNVSVGSPTNPNNQPSGPMKFKRSQLRDTAFYNEHRDEIQAAHKAGLIEDDITPR